MKNKDNFIPIIIGNCAPFRIIIRDTDDWRPSLEEINTLTYDYVRLNRNSMALDVGISPYSLIIGFDGSLILPSVTPYNTKDGSVRLLNNILGILLLGGLFSEAVTPDNVSYGHMIMEGYNYIDGFGKGHIANFHRSIRLKEVSNFDAIQLIDPITIKVEELRASYSKGRIIYKRLSHLSPSVFIEGISHYVASNWEQSLILIWTSIEQLINQLWEELVIIPELPKGRKEFLKDFRTWTSAAKVETLFLTGYIQAETYDLINKTRKVRNSFMHKAENISKDSVDIALMALFHLISLINTAYKSVNSFDNLLDMIHSHQRGDLFPKIKDNDVKYWRLIPPLPGHNSWGDEPFEIIEELRLKRIK